MLYEVIPPGGERQERIPRCMSEVAKKLEITPLSGGNAAAGSLNARPDRILSEQIKLVYTHAFSGFLVTLAGALLVVAVLWPVGGHVRLLLWSGLMMLILLGCYALSRSYRQVADTERQAKRWRSRLVAGAAALGLGWGLACPSSLPGF